MEVMTKAGALVELVYTRLNCWTMYVALVTDTFAEPPL